jgi:hypothetical protein
MGLRETMAGSTDSHLLEPGFFEDLRRERIRADAISIVGSILLGTALSILIIPFIIHCMERGFTISSSLLGRVSVIAAILAALLAWANSRGRMSQFRVERWYLRFFKTLATTGAPPRDILIAAVNESGNPKLANYVDIRGIVENPDPREFLREIEISDDSSAHRPFRNWRKRRPEASPECAIRHLHAQLMNCSRFYRRTPLLTGTAGPYDLASHRAAESSVETWAFFEMLDFDIEPERVRYRHPAVVLHSLVGDTEELPLLDAVEVTLPSVSLIDLRRARDAERIVRSRMHLTSAREDRARPPGTGSARISRGMAGRPSREGRTWRRVGNSCQHVRPLKSFSLFGPRSSSWVTIRGISPPGMESRASLPRTEKR